MYSLAFFTVTLLATASAFTLHNAHQFIHEDDIALYTSFASFAQRFARKYDNSKEVLERFNTYKTNMIMVKLSAKQEQGSAEFGEGPFMDHSVEEFRQAMFPKLMSEDPSSPECSPAKVSDSVPESFDWRKSDGVVSEVKNQGNCGSCWAFSVVGNVEGQWRLSKNMTVELSEQELLDCDNKDQACDGGFPIWAYEEIIRIGGLESEKDYPYESKKSQNCKADKTKFAAKINGFCHVKKDEEEIKRYLVANGPLSVAINANPLQFYRGGIHYPYSIFCSKRMLNHAVLLVGYGEEKGEPFWILKNSWSEKWGEQGYFRLHRGKNVCGVTEMVTSALIST